MISCAIVNRRLYSTWTLVTSQSSLDSKLGRVEWISSCDHSKTKLLALPSQASSLQPCAAVWTVVCPSAIGSQPKGSDLENCLAPAMSAQCRYTTAPVAQAQGLRGAGSSPPWPKHPWSNAQRNAPEICKGLETYLNMIPSSVGHFCCPPWLLLLVLSPWASGINHLLHLCASATSLKQDPHTQVKHPRLWAEWKCRIMT